MSFGWTFKEAAPGDRARESQVEKFFNSDAVANRANAIVREGIQNSLDASSDGAKVVVRIAIGSWPADQTQNRIAPYNSGFYEHFNAEAVRAKIPNGPAPGEAFRYLTFEDYGTSGLEGDPAQWWPEEHGAANPFFNYFRAEGISDKTEGARGRHGVGRLVFMFASRIRSILALTRRRNDQGTSELIMGTSVLRNHWAGQKPYLPDGWFGIQDRNDPRLVVPIQDNAEFAAQFRKDFALSRENERGLSVVVPWLSEDVSYAEVARAVVGGYYYPILQDKLIVELEGESGERDVIDARSLAAVVARQSPEFASHQGPLISMAAASLEPLRMIALPTSGANAPKWDAETVGEDVCQAIYDELEDGQLTALRVPVQVRPKGGRRAAAESHFTLFMQRDASLAESQIQFIREGIIISDARPRRTTAVRALVVVDEGPLASFLGDSENPSHTQWQKDLVKDRYVYAPATIEYVVQSVPSLLAIISQRQKKPDSSLLIDLFSLPTDQPQGPLVKQDKAKRKDGGKTSPPKIVVPKRPKPYSIDKRASGFVVRRGDPDAPRPELLSIKVAYGVRHGNPFSRYRKADFDLEKGQVAVEAKSCEVRERGDNWIVVRVDNDDFEVGVTGFDTEHRDLHIDVKVRQDSEAGNAETL
jgi:hypothetical protein